MEECIQTFNHWIERYPKIVEIYAFGQKGMFNTIFLSQFVGFRKKIYQLKQRNPELLGNYFDKCLDVEEFDFYIKDLE